MTDTDNTTHNHDRDDSTDAAPDSRSDADADPDATEQVVGDHQESINTVISQYSGDFETLIRDAITSATDDLRHKLSLAQTRCRHLATERDRLRERNDRLRERLYTATGEVPDTDAPDNGSGAVVAGLLDTTDHTCPLADVVQNGPGAVTGQVYPVHERAQTTLHHLLEWGSLVPTDPATNDEWAVEVTGPTVRGGIEDQRGESITSTQTRRVLEAIVEWGADCPSTPELTSDDCLRLRVSDAQLVSTLRAMDRIAAHPEQS
jgi:hypothetical protein